ncbi:site-specific integrase [Solibacillus sp. R5-41]|uniref:tyrosine-type recombinase/integrase n=1 Tax=Solibacillus sp. R5-41 TaxID=2048654 RepID=UPI001561BEE1|nr:site-specific integrase [Solibacillus sp. R5-41]
MASYEILTPTKDGKPRIKVLVEYGYDEHGKRLRKRKTITLPMLSEANIINAIAQFEKSLGIGTPIFENPLKRTFHSFSEEFMLNYVQQELKVKSRNTYENYLKQGITSYFGHMLLSKITTGLVNHFFLEQKANKAGSLVEKFVLLKSMFNKAIEWGYIQSNPCDKAVKPKRAKSKRINFYTESQIQHLLAVLPKFHIKHQLQTKIALFCGLRMTEIVALRFESLDFAHNTILVENTLQYDKLSNRFFLDSTKTGENRLVYAPKTLIQELQAYIEQKKKKLDKLGDKFNPLLDDKGKAIYFIFSKDNGYPNHPDRMSKQWSDIVIRHELPAITFHGLRHSYASYMLSKGINIKVIQEQLGHSNIRETLNTYSHVTREQKENATSLFDSFH